MRAAIFLEYGWDRRRFFICSVAFKSPATISQAQTTAQYDGTPGVLAARGRHDPCVVPRAVPIVEGMAAMVIMDHVLMQNARQAATALLPKIPVSAALPTKETLFAAVVSEASQSGAVEEGAVEAKVNGQ